MKARSLRHVSLEARCIDTASLVTLGAAINSLCARKREVRSHSLRVTEYCLIIASGCGIGERELADLYLGALFHDIGKIGIPDSVLHKPGPLNADEQLVMHQHPDIGCRIISQIGCFSSASEIIRSHHEHFDGSGYPRGLKGEAIPHGARILAVADSLDALTVRRPYHEALTFEEAMEEIIKASGKTYDPAVIQTAIQASAELRPDQNGLNQNNGEDI